MILSTADRRRARMQRQSDQARSYVPRLKRLTISPGDQSARGAPRASVASDRRDDPGRPHLRRRSRLRSSRTRPPVRRKPDMAHVPSQLSPGRRSTDAPPPNLISYGSSPGYDQRRPIPRSLGSALSWSRGSLSCGQLSSASISPAPTTTPEGRGTARGRCQLQLVIPTRCHRPRTPRHQRPPGPMPPTTRPRRQQAPPRPGLRRAAPKRQRYPAKSCGDRGCPAGPWQPGPKAARFPGGGA
jgi:hypothetical protein